MQSMANRGCTRAKPTRVEIAGADVRLNGVPFTSTRLSKTLQGAGAQGAVVVAVGAGPELEVEAQRLWLEGKPDEYFFLEVYGSAVVEHLVTMTGARLCAWAESRQMAVLPHYSPGYPEWAIDEQPRLLDLINGSRRQMPPVPVEVLESGMLRPKKSLLAVFGVTRHVERVQRLTELVPCENCSFLPCQYRRSPYRRAPEPANPELSALGGDRIADAVPTVDPAGPCREVHRQRQGVAALERRAPLDGVPGGRHDRRPLPIRRHDVHEHGPAAAVSVSGHARAARRGVSDPGTAVRPIRRRRRATPTCAGT